MTKPLVVDIPTDQAFLAQYARASIAHAQLDNALKMFVRSFDESSVEDALKYIGYTGAAKLRKRIVELATARFGKGEALDMVLQFMSHCEDISDRRNYLLHSPIARERDGPEFRMRSRGTNEWVALPPADELKALAEETFALQQDMNHQRLSGLIDAALRQYRSNPKE